MKTKFKRINFKLLKHFPIIQLLFLHLFAYSLHANTAWSLSPIPALPYIATASSDDGNIPKNTLDYLTDTRWSALGDGEWIQYDLQEIKLVNAVHIAFYKGDLRDADIEIETSMDGQDWTPAWSGIQSQRTTAFQTFTFSTMKARYIKITGHGNSINDWNSITNVYFSFDTEEPITGVLTASASSDDGNTAANVLDTDLSTRWSAFGSGQWLEIDLGTHNYFSSLQIAFFKGDQRQAMFEIQIRDSKIDNWKTVVSNAVSSGETNALETFYFGSVVLARYVRIVGYGNTTNSWNSITEVAPEPIYSF